MNTFLYWMAARLFEPSTWAGIAIGASAIQHLLSGDSTELATLAASILAMAIPEAKAKS